MVNIPSVSLVTLLHASDRLTFSSLGNIRDASRRTCSFGLLSKVGSSFRSAGFGAFERFEQVDARENERLLEILSGTSIREVLVSFR